MKQINLCSRGITRQCIVMLSILIAACTPTPAVVPPIVIQPNPVSGEPNNSAYVNLLINSIEFTGAVSNIGDTGNLQLIMVASDALGHSDALICPYGGVMQVHLGDKINPCQAGLTYPDEILQGNLYIMLIAMDIKDKSALADVGTNVITAGLSTGLGAVIQGSSAMTPQLAIGLIALSAMIGYAGTKTQEYLQKNYVIGSQSFVMSRQYGWNNGQPINAASENGQVNFDFIVQKSSTAQGELVEAAPVEPSTKLPPTEVSNNQPTSPDDQQLSDPADFARWYFTAVYKDRNYQYLWDNYMTASFRRNAGSGRYQDYVDWWSSVDRVDVNSVSVVNNDGAQAWIHVNVTFYMKDGRITKNREYDYDLLYDVNKEIWMFDYHS